MVSQPARRANQLRLFHVSQRHIDSVAKTQLATPSLSGGKCGQETLRVRVIDWEQPANNDFMLVSQFSVSGALYTCRPDLVGFVSPDYCRGWWSSS